MRSTCGRALALVSGAAVLLAGWTLVTGCGGGTGGPFQWFGGYWIYPLQGAPATSGTTSTGVTTGTSGTSSTSGSADPCQEPQARKFVRISMRNASDTYVHYFFVLIAFVNGTTYPTGSVCPTDIPLYTSFGYTQIPDGQQQTFGNYCITGPALLYMHRNGQFQAAGGTGAALASAIAPAQGTTPTYDAFFTASGASVPVPDRILFYNPGTTPEGLALKISRNATNPCSVGVITLGDPDCQQDAFYYVDNTDRLDGSTARGAGSGRRVASDVQGTGCECLSLSQSYQSIAPEGQTASNAPCNLFFRGGRIDYVYIRQDNDPPIPQLLWHVTDATGALAHNYDPRAGIQ